MSVEDLFVSGCLRWRYAGVLVTILVLQAVLPTFVCAAVNTLLVEKVFNPMTIACNTLYAVTSISWLVGLVWPSLCYLALTRLHVHNYTIVGVDIRRVWHYGRALLYPWSNIVVCGIITAVVTCLTRHYATLLHYTHFCSIVQPCFLQSVGSHVCINSRAVLAVCVGLYLGVSHGLYYTIANGNLATVTLSGIGAASVPIRQRLRSLLAPKALIRRCWVCLWGSEGVLRSVLVVVLCYAAVGGLVEQWVAAVLGDGVASSGNLATSRVASSSNLVLDTDALGAHLADLQQNITDSIAPLPAGTLHGYWSTVILYQRVTVLTEPVTVALLVLAATVVTVMMQLFYQIFVVFVMQPISLPTITSSPGTPPTLWSMSSALSSSHPVLRLLAARALAAQAMMHGKEGEAGRQPLFAISDPGGHPRNWSSVLTPTLAIIKKFTEQLLQQNCPEEYAAMTARAAAATVPASATTASVKATEPKKEPFFGGLWNRFKTNLKERVGVVWRLPGIGWLVSELPHAANANIFATAHPVVFAIQGLCHLVSASYFEDRYGIVQRDLSDILTALLHLNLTLERVSRATSAKRVFYSSYCSVAIVGADCVQPTPLHLTSTFHRAVKVALRSSLYKVANTFGDSILEVPLAPQYRNKMQSYILLMEG